MTQLSEARKGNITPEIKTVAQTEGYSPEVIAQKIAEGTVVIPKNRLRDFPAVGIGEGLTTKVNANIGTSPESYNIDKEIEKLKTAVDAGAHSIMDLSTGGDLTLVRRTVLKQSTVMVGTVPLYAIFAESVRDGKQIRDITAEDFFAALEQQAKEGVDFVTVHCGVNRDLAEWYDPATRTAGIVSRGGSLTRRWMMETGNDNPFYEHFDRLLDIAFDYDMTISLGDGMRPGGIADASDQFQLGELETLGRLVYRCRERGVQVMVEGPGHVPIHDIRFNVEIQKKLCGGAPFYVLGPLVCDIAPGYDHITGAIGGALAASYGADFLCYVTPAEHLCLPDCDDVKNGVIASMIAAHAGDIAKGIPSALERNRKMSVHRRNLEWEHMFELAIDPETARKRKKESDSAEKEYCSMCGALCALRQ
ncbi:MAG: phosphomethylpyrimidine synthase ThiC [Spirochaetota bacterium]